MSESGSSYVTSPIEPDDTTSGFSCGKHPLDDYFSRHALANDRTGIGRAYVLRRAAGDPECCLPRSFTVCPSRSSTAVTRPLPGLLAAVSDPEQIAETEERRTRRAVGAPARLPGKYATRTRCFREKLLQLLHARWLGEMSIESGL